MCAHGGQHAAVSELNYWNVEHILCLAVALSPFSHDFAISALSELSLLCTVAERGHNTSRLRQ